jgi:hypothetical protein
VQAQKTNGPAKTSAVINMRFTIFIFLPFLEAGPRVIVKLWTLARQAARKRLSAIVIEVFSEFPLESSAKNYRTADILFQ